ncbi:MAG: Gfo/Idh/MocA family oxidoreductase [Bacteroidetes bacterium]|nr:Gfo/Idh/MocA family oxidoreductase [Bacteroidota bacterium]
MEATSKELNLGILGLSEGNGHPYSWPAIINGYDKKAMENCPFPAIPEYLSAQKFPGDQIDGVTVSHIWTQDKSISKHIAKSTHIRNIVDNYEDMIEAVDGVLLARDDAENHLEMTRPFLKAGLPVYIDKPIANSVAELKKIFELEQYPGQIFTCSALRYANELKLSQQDQIFIGKIDFVDASIYNSWEKYAIHIVEPVLNIIPGSSEMIDSKVLNNHESKTVSINWKNNLRTDFTTLGPEGSPPVIRIFGKNDVKEFFFTDTFNAFKRALNAFIESIINKSQPISKESVMNVVRILEIGNSK